MTTYKTAEFWAPAMHANTLLHLSVPEPGPSRDPIVRSLPIKHGEHNPVGVIKRTLQTPQGLLVADDQFQVSALSLPTDDNPVPTVSSQSKTPVPSRGLSTWTGLASLDSGAISSLSTGRLTLYADSAEIAGSYRLGAPVLTLSSQGNTFALGGKEVEISLWDVERTFSESPSETTKRKKDDLAPGEIWRAKNVPHNNLQLRQPVHHLSSAFLGPSDIVTGTKSGSVRRYDTRQRKPVGDWKVAREGGVGCVCPSQVDSHTVFFADHSSLVGALDVRTGKLLYGVPGLGSTASYLAALPQGAGWAAPSTAPSQVAGLASISSDATLRVVGVTPAPDSPPRGNWGNGKKSVVSNSVGGVGVGTFVFAGFGSRVEERKEREKGEGGEEEEEDEEVDDDEEEELWENMSVQEDDGEEESESESDEEEEEKPVKKRRS